MSDGVADEEKPNGVLIVCLGLTPQVVTETLYCLDKLGKWPAEVVIVTTTAGRRMAEQRGLRDKLTLLSSELARCPPKVDWREVKCYDLVDFDHVQQFRGAFGEAVANVIEADRPLHVSVAGGRNSMVAAAMEVMSLMSRGEADLLTQVLVVPPEVERADGFQEFWYPPTVRGSLLSFQAWDTKTNAPALRQTDLDSQDVELNLVHIPYLPIAPITSALHAIPCRDRLALLTAATIENNQGATLVVAIDEPWVCLTVCDAEPSALRFKFVVKGDEEDMAMAPGCIPLERMQMAVLMWVVEGSMHGKVRDWRQRFEGRGSECDQPFLDLCRWVAQVVDGESPHTLTNDFLLQADKKSAHGRLLQRLKDAHADPRLGPANLKRGPGQYLSHLKTALLALGPLRPHLLDDSEPGTVRVNSARIRIERVSSPAEGARQ